MMELLFTTAVLKTFGIEPTRGLIGPIMTLWSLSMSLTCIVVCRLLVCISSSGSRALRLWCDIGIVSNRVRLRTENLLLVQSKIGRFRLTCPVHLACVTWVTFRIVDTGMVNRRLLTCMRMVRAMVRAKGRCIANEALCLRVELTLSELLSRPTLSVIMLTLIL